MRSFVSRLTIFLHWASYLSVYIARASYWHARSCGRVPIIIESNYISAGRQNWQNDRGCIVTLSQDIQLDLSLSFLSHGVCQCSRVEDGSGVRVAERCDENVLLAYLRLWEKRVVPRKTCRNSIQFYVCVCAWENPFSPRVYPPLFPPATLHPSHQPIGLLMRVKDCFHSLIRSFIRSFIHLSVRSLLRNSYMISCALDEIESRMNYSLNESLINDNEYHFLVMTDF